MNLKLDWKAQARFWAKVKQGKPNDDWFWTGAVDSQGYPAFGLGTSNAVSGRRVAATMRYGEIPPGKYVSDTCGYIMCVNPAHLVLSEQARAKLTTEKVVEIRTRAAAGESRAKLCVEYGVTAKAVSELLRGLTWKNAGGPIAKTRKRK